MRFALLALLVASVAWAGPVREGWNDAVHTTKAAAHEAKQNTKAAFKKDKKKKNTQK